MGIFGMSYATKKRLHLNPGLKEEPKGLEKIQEKKFVKKEIEKPIYYKLGYEIGKKAEKK